MMRKEKVMEQASAYNVTVTGRHVQVTDAMKAYAVEKISKLERFAPRIIDVAVTMDIVRFQQRVDIVMKYGHTIFKSYGESTDMYVSVDQAVKRLEVQVIKYQKRLHNHHPKGSKSPKMEEIEIPEKVYAPITFEEEVDELNEEIEMNTNRRQVDERSMHQIVKTEMQPLSVLTNYEAIIKMDFSNAPVLVYRSEADHKLKVIYRRHDGNYGVIEPE